ncbi:MAG: hypothetical protein EA341_19125 [Mongoliibacter sp.]|nr:MAG: hypothetical protein EA341_19125 [Mongoliibacter sp.]
MAGMLFFSDVIGVKVSWEVYLLLGMAVWCIYSIDHLIDGRSLKDSHMAFPRHVFHHRYFKTILLTVLVFILIGVLLMMFLEKLWYLRVPGFSLTALVTVWFYFLFKLGKKAAWLKEISTASIYVFGIALGPVVTKGVHDLIPLFWLFAVLYLGIAILNLFILSYIDAEVDKTEGYGSILSLMSKRTLRNSIFWIGTIIFITLVMLLFYLPSFFKIHSGILLLIVGLHLHYFFSKRQKKEAVRQKLEASFILPLILLVF